MVQIKRDALCICICSIVLNEIHLYHDVTRSLKRSRARSKMDNVQRKKIVRDRRQGRQVVDKDVSIAKSRYNATYLIDIIKGLDNDQRQFIRDTDFGFLLELDIGDIPWSFVQWLADHVDVDSEEFVFYQKSIPISVDSFGHVLGLTVTGDPVPPETKSSTMEFLQLFGLTEMPSVKYFGDKIKKKGQQKDEFLTCFFVVAFASFYCPTSSVKPSTSYLPALMQVEKMKSYNWGQYVHNWNLFYVKKYQIFSSTLGVCNYYFAVRYLDFLDFGAGLIPPTLPRILVWKGEMIKNYINQDMDEDNFYGRRTIKEVSEACYSTVSVTTPESITSSVDNLRNSIQSLDQRVFTEKMSKSVKFLRTSRYIATVHY